MEWSEYVGSIETLLVFSTLIRDDTWPCIGKSELGSYVKEAMLEIWYLSGI